MVLPTGGTVAFPRHIGGESRFDVAARRRQRASNTT